MDAKRRPHLSLLRRPVLVGIAVLIAYGFLRALVEVRVYVGTAFFAVVLAAMLTHPIGLLARVMPRAVATILTLIAFLGLLVGVSIVAAPVIGGEGAQLVHQLPGWVDRLMGRLPGGWWGHMIKQGAGGQVAPAVASLAPVAVGALRGLVAAVLVIALAFFLAAAPETYRRALRRLVPPEKRTLFDEWWRRAGGALGRWTLGILVSMAVMGLLSGLGLLLIGVDGWPLLSLLTFLGTFVPYAGAVASGIPALLVGFGMSPMTGVWVLLLYTGVHLVEGYLVQPLIMRRAVEIKPAVLLVWQVILGGLFGIVGVIVATPALACVQETVELLWVERSLGDPQPMETV